MRLVRRSRCRRWIGHKIDPSMSAVSPGPPVWVQSAEILRSSAAYRRLRDRRGAAVRLPIPAAAWVVELLRAELRRPALVLVPHEADVAAWLEAVRLFSADGSDSQTDGGDSAIEFPSPSLSPYQETDAALPVLAAESAALERLRSVGAAGATGHASATVVCTPRALFRRLPTARLENATTIEVRAGSEAFQEEFLLKLVAAGYRREDLVLDVGSFAARGGVVDVFPAGAAQPLRFDWFGDTVESIRVFDPDSQRSLEAQDSARLPRCSLSGGQRDRESCRRRAAAPFDRRRRRRQRRRSRQGEGPANRRAVSRLAQLSALDRRRNHLAPRLAPGAARGDGRPSGSRDRGACPRRASARRSRSATRPWPVVGPARALEQPLHFVLGVLDRAAIEIGDPLRASADAADFSGQATDVLHRQLPRFPREVETARGRGERLVVAPPRSSHSRRASCSRATAASPESNSSTASCVAGSVCLPPVGGLRRRPAARADGPPGAASGRSQESQEPPANLRRRPARPEGRRLRRPRRSRHRPVHRPARAWAASPPSLAASAVLAERPRRSSAGRGGRGRPRGHGDRLRRGQDAAAAALAPRPVQRYSGIEGVEPRLDRLGGSCWSKTKAAGQAALRDMAKELLKLYAERQLAQAPALPPDSDLQRQFEAAFEFDETEDQLAATDAISRTSRAAADGPPALRRRRLRQDRGRDARRLQGRRQRLPGGGAVADDHPRRPAPGDLQPSLGGVSGQDRHGVALPFGQGSARRSRSVSKSARSTS